MLLLYYLFHLHSYTHKSNLYLFPQHNSKYHFKMASSATEPDVKIVINNVFSVDPVMNPDYIIKNDAKGTQLEVKVSGNVFKMDNSIKVVAFREEGQYRVEHARRDSMFGCIIIMSPSPPVWLPDVSAFCLYKKLESKTMANSLTSDELATYFDKDINWMRKLQLDIEYRKLSFATHNPANASLVDAPSHLSGVGAFAHKTINIQFVDEFAEQNGTAFDFTTKSKALELKDGSNTVYYFNGHQVGTKIVGSECIGVALVKSSQAPDAILEVINKYNVVFVVSQNEAIDPTVHQSHPNAISVPNSFFVGDEKEVLHKTLFLVKSLSESAEYNNRFIGTNEDITQITANMEALQNI